MIKDILVVAGTIGRTALAIVFWALIISSLFSQTNTQTDPSGADNKKTRIVPIINKENVFVEPSVVDEKIADLAAIPAVSTSIVVSQIYGGGGNSGSLYWNDYIELFNRGDVLVSVDGWSVQYASATGTTWQVTALSGSIPPGGYYLVQEAAGVANTGQLPAPNAVGIIPIGTAAGKIMLSSTTFALSGACPSSSSMVDLVGYGATANCFETLPAAATVLTNSTALVRAAGGCQDGDFNNADFSVVTPAPRSSSSSPQHPCNVQFSMSGTVKTAGGRGITNALVTVTDGATGQT